MPAGGDRCFSPYDGTIATLGITAKLWGFGMEPLESTSADFAQVRIAAFENRRSSEMARMIQQSNGRPFMSAAMQEIAIENNVQAVDFANRLMTGQVDILILLTGVGFQMLLAAVERRVDRGRFVDCLKDTITIARGPKPLAALRAEGIQASFAVPAPNTWRELLATVDQQVNVSGQRVVIQEYGRSNPSLMAGLEARGATVDRLPIYRWKLPDDLGPLEENIRAVAAGEREALMFTSAQQVVHLMQIAEQLGLANRLREAIDQVVICSIGPTTSEELVAAGLPVDFEPSHPKLGHLVRESAQQMQQLIDRKRR